jgi:redox-sensitive bicupin YhaK (pirin superfamily)
MTEASHPPDLIVLSPAEHAVLGEAEFGTPGLVAVESIGPFTRVRSCGPLITVHDSVISAGLGIGHHPHRYNERLFYLERGSFDHDDTLNGIAGHVPEGALARFTEGRRGMVHQEWNHGEVDAEIYILVASTDPIPAETSFEILPRESMPVHAEGARVVIREMVGPQSPLPVFSDVRLFTDTTLPAGAAVDWLLGEGEGGLLSVREGEITLADGDLGSRYTVLVPPGPGRTVTMSSGPGARVIRATFGPGHGLVMDT